MLPDGIVVKRKNWWNKLLVMSLSTLPMELIISIFQRKFISRPSIPAREAGDNKHQQQVLSRSHSTILIVLFLRKSPNTCRFHWIQSDVQNKKLLVCGWVCLFSLLRIWSVCVCVYLFILEIILPEYANEWMNAYARTCKTMLAVNKIERERRPPVRIFSKNLSEIL